MQSSGWIYPTNTKFAVRPQINPVRLRVCRQTQIASVDVSDCISRRLPLSLLGDIMSLGDPPNLPTRVSWWLMHSFGKGKKSEEIILGRQATDPESSGR
ncbi:hypothetical protein BaRGS_00002079 [Batillaria attramentaria]|uniref:Uncharacterized protein n=1 Tax=Batillaria attramentaria TaxID=370345 RepID=A0ABD0M5D7_9CAEN